MEVRSLEAIFRALNTARVEYLVVGGLAVVAHGYVRTTDDVDLAIGLQPENIIRALRALIDIGFVMAIPVRPEDFADASLRETWRREKGMLVLKMLSDRHPSTPVDIFVYEPFDVSAEFAKARMESLSDDLQVPVASLDCLLAMKRDAARPQDLADIDNLERVRQLTDES